MKPIFTLMLSTAFVISCSSNHKHVTLVEQTQAMKTAEAEGVVAGMLAAADKHDWKTFENSFANQTVVIREAPELMRPEDITNRMSPTLEWFDSTQHKLDGFKIEEKNGRLLGTADLKVNYWKNRGLNSDVGTTSSKLAYEFIREGEVLKIMRMQWVSEKMSGDKDILETAWKKSLLRKNPFIVDVVDFPSKNKKNMRGFVYIPGKNVHDVVILSGNLANVKEQGPLQYARLLAGRGIGVLVFDYVNFGESDGPVRNLEDPGQKIEDLRAAVDFISHREEFAGARISLATLGASAGYASAEAVNDPRIDRLLLIAPWIQSPDLASEFYKNPGEKILASRQANHQFQQDGVLTYVPVASYSDQSAVLYTDSNSSLDYYLNPNRGGIPQWENQFATMGWGPWLNFDGVSSASRVRVPTLIIQSRAGDFLAGVEEYTARMRLKPEMHWLSASQYDFYDRAETMNDVVEIVDEFLNPSHAETEVTKL